MQRKKVTALLTAALLIGTVCSCGTQKPDSEAGQETLLTDTTESVSSQSGMEAVNDKELNILDDNFRTCYEVFVYSFYDSNGDGIGDLPGLAQKLDYINDGDPKTDTDLGCTAIWLMPVMPSPTYHKYDVTDYYNIDTQYGSLEDFRSLVEQCHERGIHVVLDFVMNHTSSQHEWFKEACSYLCTLEAGEEPDPAACRYLEYYNFQKEAGSGYSKVAGTKDDWYYEAQFWSEMPDLNLNSEAVRQEFTDIVQFWLDQGVDGFRLDAVTSYYTGNDDSNIEVLGWFADMVKAKKQDAYIVGEAWMDYTSYGKYYASGVDSFFDFSAADKDGVIAKAVKGIAPASSYGEYLKQSQDYYKGFSETYINAPFYTNHDMARSAGFYAGDFSQNQTKMAQAMNLMMDGCAFLYYGEELGMKGAGIDENKRLAMYWSKDKSSEGMCRGPAGAEQVEMKYDSLEEQVKDPYSIYNFVKQVIKLRNIYPEISHGEIEALSDLSNESICAVKKTYEGSELLIVFNLSQNEQTIDLSGVSLNGKAAGEVTEAGMLQTTEKAVITEGSTAVMPEYSVMLYQ